MFIIFFSLYDVPVHVLNWLQALELMLFFLVVLEALQGGSAPTSNVPSGGAQVWPLQVLVRLRQGACQGGGAPAAQAAEGDCQEHGEVQSPRSQRTHHQGVCPRQVCRETEAQG